MSLVDADSLVHRCTNVNCKYAYQICKMGIAAMSKDAHNGAMVDLLDPSDLERLAAERGQTMRSICARAGISHTTWYRWRAGRTSPTLQVYRRLLNAINTNAGGNNVDKSSAS